MHELRSILFVDDDESIRAVAELALEMVGGFTLRSCAGGLEAIAAVEQGCAPDLLLLDVMMPGMDGPAVLERLRALPATAATPAVFMTARVQADEVAHLRSLGALGVVAKPFDPMTLAQTLRDIWAGR